METVSSQRPFLCGRIPPRPKREIRDLRRQLRNLPKMPEANRREMTMSLIQNRLAYHPDWPTAWMSRPSIYRYFKRLAKEMRRIGEKAAAKDLLCKVRGELGIWALRLPYLGFLLGLAGGVVIFQNCSQLLRGFLGLIGHQIINNCMEPNYGEGDSFLIEKKPIQRFDCVIIEPPDVPGGSYFKRVIGLPGDRVGIEKGVIHVNGSPLALPFTRYPSETSFDEIQVPLGTYFVLGDHLDVSHDSRSFGFVPEGNIFGVAHMLIRDLTHDKARYRSYVASTAKNR